MKQNELLFAINKLIPSNKSLIEVISSVLDISYASAHRRTSQTAKLSIDEAIKLAKHFDLSLDLLFNIGEKNIIQIKKSQITTNIKELEDYFKYFTDSFELLSKTKDVTFIYCVKDLPLSTSVEFQALTKFKIFVWLKLINPSFEKKIFSDFTISVEIKKSCYKLGVVTNNLKKTEIWDTTTINSILKQILYYYSLNHITNEEALLICDELKDAILLLKKKITPDSNIKLYNTELLLLNNKVLIKTPISSTLYLQYTGMNYFKTSDVDTCKHTSDYLNRILKSCQLINTSSEKEKKLFFNKMLNKINSLNEHILGQKTLDF